MDARTARFLGSAFSALALSVYFFVTYTSTTSYQSTFVLQPGSGYVYPATLNPSDVVSGQFQESSGMPVSLYILSSGQFNSYFNTVRHYFDYLYSVTNTASGSFSYTITSQDTYYLFFNHGTGLDNTTETVYAQRAYTTHINYRLYFGFPSLGVAAVNFFYAYRSKVTEPERKTENKIKAKMLEISGLTNDQIDALSDDKFDELYRKAVESI